MSIRKTVLTWLSLLALLALCPFANVSFAGGMSGGGGNVFPVRVPESYQDPEQVEDSIHSSRRMAVQTLQTLQSELAVAESADPILSAIFALPGDIVATSQRVKPHIEEDEPCYDRHGAPVDGSILSERAGRFCISAFTIAQKVHAEEIQAQAAALMIHEYSELVGASEEEAQHIQKAALNKLLSFQ